MTRITAVRLDRISRDAGRVVSLPRPHAARTGLIA